MSNRKTILTDEQVIECRRRFEYEGWRRFELLREYEKYGVSKEYLRQLLRYQVRSKLIPVAPVS